MSIIKKKIRKCKVIKAIKDAITFVIAAAGILLIWSAVQAIEDGLYILPGILQMIIGFAILALLQMATKIAREIRNEERREANAWNHRSTSFDGPDHLHSRTEP